MRKISESAFDSVWAVRVAGDGDLLRFEEICGLPERQVWTVVESGDDRDGNWYALPGVHVVNENWLGRLYPQVRTETYVEDTQWRPLTFSLKVTVKCTLPAFVGVASARAIDCTAGGLLML